jgi:hypothetical protein
MDRADLNLLDAAVVQDAPATPSVTVPFTSAVRLSPNLLTIFNLGYQRLDTIKEWAESASIAQLVDVIKRVGSQIPGAHAETVKNAAPQLAEIVIQVAWRTRSKWGQHLPSESYEDSREILQGLCACVRSVLDHLPGATFEREPEKKHIHPGMSFAFSRGSLLNLEVVLEKILAFPRIPFSKPGDSGCLYQNLAGDGPQLGLPDSSP